jgi:uncharacterized protein YxjI
MSKQFVTILESTSKIFINQVHEIIESLTPFETRNKYRIFDDKMKPLAFAAEASRYRRWAPLRSWRSYEIEIFSTERELIYVAKSPFRWFFNCLSLKDNTGRFVGELNQKFSLFYRKFELIDSRGMLIAQLESPWFKFWTFEFRKNGKKLATIKKKWSGGISEILTDKDDFVVSFSARNINGEIKALIMASCLLIDMTYFENNRGLGTLLDIAKKLK